MSKYSFFGSKEENKRVVDSYQKATNTGYKAPYETKVSVPSDKAYSFYLDLCKRKKIAVQPKSAFTFETMSNEITRLRDMPDGISDAQYAKIQEIYVTLQKLNAPIKYYTDEELGKLTAGREGTGSKYITWLLNKSEELNEMAPLTEEQKETLIGWFYCPDIPFESLTIQRDTGSKIISVPRTKPVKQLTSWSTDHNVPEELEGRAFIALTPEEFAHQLELNVTKKDANALITMYRGTFYDWRRTKASDRMINHIRTLEKRISNMYIPKPVDLAFDPETGEIIEFSQDTTHNIIGEISQQGYTPLTEEQLYMMSSTDAKMLIDQMYAELEGIKEGRMIFDKDGRNPEKLVNPDNQYFTDKHSAFNERTHEGLANQETARIVESVALTDMVFALEAMAGREDNYLHELVNDSFIDEDRAVIIEDEKLTAYEYVADFMYDLIDWSKDTDNIMKQVGAFATITEKTVVGSTIAQAVAQRVMSRIFGQE